MLQNIFLQNMPSKLLKLTDYVPWTAVLLDFCDFAAQNYFTKMQKHGRRLVKRSSS